MRPYSDFAAQRTRQIIADTIAVVLIVISIVIGTQLGLGIAAIGLLGSGLASAGLGFQGSMAEVGESLAAIPLIGPGIAAPFSGASEAGATLAEAGSAFQSAMGVLGFVVGFLVAAGPIAVLLLVWLLPRLRFAIRAGRLHGAASSGAPLDLLALRALVHRRLPKVEAIGADPAGAWRRGDERVIRELAALELRAAGVRLP